MDVAKNIGVQLLTWTVDVLVIFLKNSINLLQYSYNTFPQATSVLFSIILIYFIYRFTIKMVKAWIAMVISFIKFTLVFLVLATSVLIYSRGYSTFFNSDIYAIKNILTKSDPSRVFDSLLYLFPKNFDFRFEVNNSEDNNDRTIDIELDSDYIDYMKESFHNAVDDGSAQANIEKLSNFLGDQGIDVNNLGDRFFNRFGTT